MAQGNGGAGIVKLEDFDGEVAEHWRDARGSAVLDKNGDEVGTVGETYVRPETATAHLSKVSGEGRTVLFPVYAVRNVDKGGVRVEENADVIMAAPGHDSDDVPDDEARKAALAYFGYADPTGL